ncbi:MAG: GGDEF domain-containing protein [Chloroflexota bacterium]
MKLRLPRVPVHRPRNPVGESKAWAALSMAWMAVTLSATSYLDAGPTRVLPPALQAVTTTIGLWRPIPYAGPIAAVLGAIVYVVAGVLSRFGSSALGAELPTTQQAAVGALLEAAPGFVSVFLALLGSGWLAELLATRTDRDELQRRHDRGLIEDLIPTYGDTGILKWTYAERTIRDEVTRARRYGYPLSFALLGRSDATNLDSEPNLDEAAAQHASLAGSMKEVLRPTDLITLYRSGELAVLLPHTPLAGALVALEKIRVQAGKAGLSGVSAGLAEFPEDGADVEELCAEAEHALAFARDSGLPVVSRGLLG